VQDNGYLTRFSANSEYSSNFPSEAPESLSNVLGVDSNGWGTGKSVQTILVAVFLGFMLSSPMSPVSSCRSASATMTAGECRSLEELGERGHMGGEVVYLGLHAAGEGRSEVESFKPR
jgi:hypothetical protein